MKMRHLLATASFAVATVALLPGISAAQQQVSLKRLTVNEFKQIHGTTDRFELLGMEVKGDCTQCHERKTETEIRVGVGFLFRQETEGGETLRPFDLLPSHPVGEFDFYHRDPTWGQMNARGTYLGDKNHHLEIDGRYRSVANGSFTSIFFPHNEEHLLFPPATAEVPVPQYNPQDLNPGADYRKELSEQELKLRFGPQTYPAHVTFQARRYAVRGNMQQQFLDENCTSNCHNISETRDLKLTTAEFTGGADAHVGWAALSYKFDYTQLRDDARDPVHNYGVIPGVSAGGEIAHNTFPDMTAWEHTVTANTMLSGGLSAWGSFTLGQRRNEDVEIDENYYRGLADALWHPFEWFTVAAKYRRTQRREEVSDDATAAFRTVAGFPAEYGVTEDRYSGVITVLPFRSLTLTGDFVHKEENRTDADGYGGAANSRGNQWGLVASYRPVRRITVRGSYSGLRTQDEPTYSTLPSDSRSLRLWATAQPWWFLLLNLNWQNTNAENRFSDFKNDENTVQLGFTLTPHATVSLGAYFSHFKTDADRPEGNIPVGTFLLIDDGMSYSAKGNQYLLQAAWRPTDRLVSQLQYSWLSADGSLSADSATYGDLGDYTDFKATQQDLSLDLQYEMMNGWGVQGRAALSRFKETDVDNDEKVTDVRIQLSKRW